MLGRTPSQADITYWVDRSRTMTPAQIRATIENTDEAFKKNIDKKLTEARAWKTLAEAHVANAKKENDATYKISTQDQIEKKDLQTIANKEKYVRDAKSQVQNAAATIGQNYQRALKLNLSQATELQGIVSNLSSNVKLLDGYLQNIAADYKRAEQKYEALLSFYNVTGQLDAERIRCQANGGTWQWWRNHCEMPVVVPQSVPAVVPPVAGCPANINANSSRECIRLLQTMLQAGGFYSGALDGLWGNLTSQAFYRWRSGMSAGTTSGNTSGTLPRYSEPSLVRCDPRTTLVLGPPVKSVLNLRKTPIYDVSPTVHAYSCLRNAKITFQCPFNYQVEKFVGVYSCER